ncbi:DNA cytosine methyltransferase [Burkholderia ambifaria]|uniref:DNA cytosine methyltransferase n=1 Tax=Burkholderia ambifaria TaxID=152480 RepID=UPI001B986009|nr:DNA cytosine methyltransferase [Burkholderia ambifaria]MBR7929439.1 DNA cytosine methyltransferase [Burkholderia ambifaria]
MKAIDLFAGAGGFSTGAKMAGIDVVWAANHWPAAIEIHASNHPGTVHISQDLHQADWSAVPAHDILLAAPCCQGHSPARGKAANNPQHDASRSTAWAVVSALEFHRPQFGVVENVREFVNWQLYPAWQVAVQALGYQVAPHVIDAADHGVPQHRERLFIVLSRSARPLMLQLPQREHVAAAQIIDFDSGNWSSVEKPGRSVATLKRIANGRRAHGDRFVAPYYGSGSGETGRSLARPLGTITTRDRWAVIDGDRMRMLSKEEARDAMSFPRNYILPRQHRLAMHMLGNAVAPVVARDVLNALLEAV